MAAHRARTYIPGVNPLLMSLAAVPMQPWEALNPLMAALLVITVLVVLAIGYLLGRALSGQMRTAESGPAAMAASEATDMRRALRRMEQEVNEMTLFFVALPDLIKQLNDNRDKRHIAPLLLRLLDVIFEPGQICIFYRSAREDGVFKLAASKGLPRAIEDKGLLVRAGEGRVGFVAEHQMVMDARDFVTSPSFHGDGPGSTGRIQIDLIAPMLDADDHRTIGIITVGNLTRTPRNEKKMIKMVADLGSMGIKNADYHQRIQTQANEDSLTKLYNKRFGADQLSLSINRAEKENKPLSIFLFDIDHFKTYNDTNGHLEGDEVLRQIGRLVAGTIRADDFAARFGGEEFLVVFQDTDKEGALIAADKLRRQVESFPFPHQEHQPGGKLTISGGVAAFRTDSRSSTELIRLADEALYEAKKEGRNRVLGCRTPYMSGGTEPEPIRL